jgi:hypothetical protein
MISAFFPSNAKNVVSDAMIRVSPNDPSGG